MSKSPEAFRTIREVADWLGVAAHVLRFWESKFSQIRPVKRAGGRRYYRPSDMELLGGIKVLLHDRGMTVRGVQRLLREEGVAAVSALSPPLDRTEIAGELVEGIGEKDAWRQDAREEAAAAAREDDAASGAPERATEDVDASQEPEEAAPAPAPEPSESEGETEEVAEEWAEEASAEAASPVSPAPEPEGLSSMETPKDHPVPQLEPGAESASEEPVGVVSEKSVAAASEPAGEPSALSHPTEPEREQAEAATPVPAEQPPPATPAREPSLRAGAPEMPAVADALDRLAAIAASPKPLPPEARPALDELRALKARIEAPIGEPEG
jgi:DNA-binding transcriptional MerR regulator